MASNAITILNPPDVAPPKPTYSHVGICSTRTPSKIIAIAGQGPTDINYQTVPGGHDEQVKAAIENVAKCLRAAGASAKDVIKCTHYVVDYDHLNRGWSRHFIEFFGGVPPPTTLVPVTKLAWPDWLYEIEVLAIVPEQE